MEKGIMKITMRNGIELDALMVWTRADIRLYRLTDARRWKTSDKPMNLQDVSDASFKDIMNMASFFEENDNK